ncbi:unnamed protein product, partial [Scytosiphon promiscuus]
QGPPGYPDRQPLVPLGLCPGEHTVSAWGLSTSSTGGERSSSLVVSSAAPEFFTLHAARSAKAAAAAVSDYPPPSPTPEAVRDRNDHKSGSDHVGGADPFGDAENECDGSERQPPLPGRAPGTTHGRDGGLCRVCAHTTAQKRLDGDGDDGSGRETYYEASSLLPPERKRLLLRTSMIVTYSKGGRTGPTGGGAQEDQDHPADEATEGEAEQQAFEWPIELREGDSPAAVAREFVVARLGLDVRPRETDSDAIPGHAASSASTSAESQEEGSTLPRRDEEGVAAAESATDGERVALWVTQKLQAEVAERQVRRGNKRVEAMETASRTGNLRVVLGAVVGAEGDDNHLVHSPDNGWLTTDVNLLDATDPSDFEYLLAPAGAVDAFVAEHVWEHLSLQDAHRATRNCERYLRPGGRLRLAVPDPAWYSGGSAECSPVSHRNDGSTSCGAGSSAAESPAPDSGVDLPSTGCRVGGSPTTLGDPPTLGEETRSCKPDNGRNSTSLEGAGPLLPGWLSHKMLQADVRDGHLVQYTPELLANVCWSSGLNPNYATEAVGEAAGEGSGHDDLRREGRLAREQPVSPPSAVRRAAGRREPERKTEEPHEWGWVKRSVAGGDPRGAVSIVMDCIKPSGKREVERDLENSSHRPEISEGVEASGSDQASRSTRSYHQGIDHGFDSPVPPQQQLSPLDSFPYNAGDLPKPTESGEDEARTSSFASTAAGTTLGDTHGPSAGDGPRGGGEATGTKGDDRLVGDDGGGYNGLGACDKLECRANPLRKRKQTLREWAAAARTNGRIVWPPQPPDASTPRKERSTQKPMGGAALPTAQDLDSARSRASKAVRAGDVAATIALCQEILEQWPCDAAAHLYRGAAMAQSGEWGAAWNEMEHVLALSSGEQESAMAALAADTGDPRFVDKEDGKHRNITERLASSYEASRARRKVPSEIALAASANLASFARLRAAETMDPRAEMFFLVDGLRAAAGRELVDRAKIKAAAAKLRAPLPPHWSAPTAGGTSGGKRDEATSSVESSSKKSIERDDGDIGCIGDFDNVARIDEISNILFTMGRALEREGQLTSALRVYQRAILLGGNQNHRALHALGGISRRLLQEQPKKAQSRSAIPTEGSTASIASQTSSTPFSPSAFRLEAQDRTGRCDWTITHPRPGQVFSPEEVIHVEVDLTLLDPGLPSAGTLFETDVIGGGGNSVDGLPDAGQDGGEGDIGVARDGLGFVVCSFLDSFEEAQCLPRLQLQHVQLGWHELTAEVYQMPSLRAFSCPWRDGTVGHGTERHSKRTVRFCVGDADTSCRPTGGELSGPSQPDAATVGFDSTERPPQHGHPRHPSDARSGGLPEHIQASTKQETYLSYAARLHNGVDGGKRVAATAIATEQDEIELPFCFMTLALNAMPFITHHAPIFDEVGRILSERAAVAATAAAASSSNGSLDDPACPESDDGCDITYTHPPPAPDAFWEWHVVEGVAAGRSNHDRPSSRQRIPDSFFDQETGLSIDGTTEYLDRLVGDGGGASSPQRKGRIHVHRRCGSRRIQNRPSGAAGSHDRDVLRKASDDVPPPRAAVQEKEKYGSGSEADRRFDFASADGGGGARTSCLWRDKIQMVNVAAFSLEKECVLVEIDADELWTAEQLVRLRDMFLLERNGDNQDKADISRAGDEGKDSGLREQYSVKAEEEENLKLEPGQVGDDGEGQPPEEPPPPRPPQDEHQDQEHDRHELRPSNRQCAYFHCHFFIGPDLITVTDDGWGHSVANEWLRAWIFRPGESVWLQHAPPGLATHDETEGWVVLAGDECIGREETKDLGLVFTHYAYVLEEQVRFKDEYHGHSEAMRAQQATTATATPKDAVAGWRALQKADPPVLVADHLTWLRAKGNFYEPRLETTVADRPHRCSSFPMGRWNRLHDRRAREDDGQSELEELPISNNCEPFPGSRGEYSNEREGQDGTNSPKNTSHAEGHTPSSRAGLPLAPIVPLEPFLQLAEEGRKDGSTMSVYGRRRGRNQTADPTQGRSCLTHDVHASLRGYRSRGKRWREPEERFRREKNCGLFHVVVDGAVFQIYAAEPAGIWRVWAKVLPAMMDRLKEFDGTCLTLLVRGLAPPVAVIQEAFSGQPTERFAVTHVPPYNPSIGHIADEVMLAWAVQNAGATAFISTLYTQPFQATTRDIVRVLLIHDVLPEVFGWDMSTGEWLQKAKAVATASNVVAVSRYAARSFLGVYPSHAASSSAHTADDALGCTKGSPPMAAGRRPGSIWAANNAVDTTVFRPRTAADNNLTEGKEVVNKFRQLAGLGPATPYVIIVGARNGYKNVRAAYRAFGLATTPASASVKSTAALGSPTLILIGGGPLLPDELELLADVSAWSHVGVGSGATGDRGGTDALEDALLAEGYSGAVALLHLSIGEGFGLTVLEAFACGCPVIAADIPPVREIAGLPDLEGSKSLATAPASGAGASTGKAKKDHGLPAREGATHSGGGDTASSRGREGGRYDGSSFPLEGGLILLENTFPATQIWRAVRAMAAMGHERRALASAALVRRAQVFNSWQPLADTLIMAAVEH